MAELAQNEEDQVYLLEKPMPRGEMIDQTYWSSFKTVAQYLYSDLLRKQRAFRIGVCTIFLVVSFITMLKAVVDVSPIAFLKLAQNQGGNFDFQMVSSAGNMLSPGDLNYYGVDPFEWDDREVIDEPEEAPSFFEQVSGGVYADNVDHTEVLGFSLLNFDVYKKMLDPLNGEQFKGFTPRWMLPARVRNPKKPNL